MPLDQPAPDAPFFIILNAGSGHEVTELRRSTIEDVLNQAGRSFQLEVVEDGSELDSIAERVVAQAKASKGIVVAAGGDGTINAVAARTVASGCPFGVLPQGTFNYFGRTHGIPEELGDAVRALLTAQMQAVQIGMVNDRIFLVNASIGLYPRMLEERELDKRHYGRSRAVALLSAFKTMLSWGKNLHVRLEIDGKQFSLRTPTLFIGNNRLQMEQVGIEPLSAALEEGRLAAVAPKALGRWSMLGLLARGAIGRLGDAKDLIAFDFKKMTVTKKSLYGKRRMKVATDGEVCKLDMPLRFCVLEGQLLLLKPIEQKQKPADFPSPTPPARHPA